jgi:DNA-binding beta-propeller fold protein YncE
LNQSWSYFTVTVTAAANASTMQNIPLTVSASAFAGVAPVTTTIFLDVTPAPGSLTNNRSDYLPTGDAPSALVYDPALDLIFACNSVWNRIDVVSNKTHQLQRSIPVRGPQVIDLSQDGTTLWIGTDSRRIYALNTATFELTSYLAPSISAMGWGSNWEANELLALSDGTLLLNLSPTAGTGI